MVPVQKNKANFGMVDKWLFGPKKSLNSLKKYMNYW